MVFNLDYLNYTSALKQFKFVVDRFPKHYEALVGYSDALYGTSKYKEAVKMYLRSLKINDKNPEVVFRLAQLYEGNMSEIPDHKTIAVGYYESYIKLKKPPKSHEIHMQLANLKAVIQMEAEE